MLIGMFFLMVAVITIFYFAYKIINNMPTYKEIIWVDEKEFKQTNIRGEL